MAATKHNHANYERRLTFIRREIPFPTRFNIEVKIRLLQPRQRFICRLSHECLLQMLRDQLTHRRLTKKADITPIAYDAECPFDYNNFIYRLTLSSATTSEDNTKETLMQQQAGCKAIPAGVTEFIVRLTNPNADGMNTENRVENEVAMINLVGAALSHYNPKVVPSVYSWGSAAAESSQGWMLQELMLGAPVDVAFDSMDLQNKKAIFAQMVGMLSEMQKYRLLPSITGFGGLTFDSAGRIVSSRMTSVDAGPWPSYEEQYKGRLRVALARADTNPYIRGWQANGVRKRIDAFVDHGVHAQFLNLASKEEKVLTHADFSEFGPHVVL